MMHSSPAFPPQVPLSGVDLIVSEKLERYFGSMLSSCREMKTLLMLIALSMIGAPFVRAQAGHFSPPLRAEQLMGLKVEDTDGQRIGSVRNLILDARTGGLKYAVIASGGFLGVRSTLRLAPAQIISAATTKRQTLAINATMHEWLNAPAFKSSQLASLSEPDQAREIASFFAASRSLSQTSSDEQTNTQPQTLKFASDFIGQRVVNPKQQRIGEVLDLLISFGRPHPAFAIISTGKFFREGHHYYVIPLSALTKDNPRKLRANVDSSALETAPPFTEQVWNMPNLSDSLAIYRYSRIGE